MGTKYASLYRHGEIAQRALPSCPPEAVAVSQLEPPAAGDLWRHAIPQSAARATVIGQIGYTFGPIQPLNDSIQLMPR
jgi:hypothetical protein